MSWKRMFLGNAHSGVAVWPVLCGWSLSSKRGFIKRILFCNTRKLDDFKIHKWFSQDIACPSLTWHQGLLTAKAQLSSCKTQTKPETFPVWPFAENVCRALSHRLTKERTK